MRHSGKCPQIPEKCLPYIPEERHLGLASLQLLFIFNLRLSTIAFGRHASEFKGYIN